MNVSVHVDEVVVHDLRLSPRERELLGPAIARELRRRSGAVPTAAELAAGDRAPRAVRHVAVEVATAIGRRLPGGDGR